MAEAKQMSTREKIGTTARKLVKHLYENREKTIKIEQTFEEVHGFIQDAKKFLDLLFILDGVGIIQRISKKKFVFLGLKGMANRIHEYAKRKILKQSTPRDQHLISIITCLLPSKQFSEDIVINNKRIPIKTSVLQGFFFQEVFCALSLQSSKLLSRSQLDQILENYREIHTKTLINDLHSIFLTLNIGERNETIETITYIGPEILNYKRLCFENLRTVNPASLKTIIIDSAKKDTIFFNHLTKEVEEKRQKKGPVSNSNPLKELNLDAAELEQINRILSLQLSQALNAEASTNVNEQIEKAPIEQVKEIAIDPVIQQETIDFSEVPKAHISYFPKVAFALLKGRTWQYYIQKLQIIIGRSLVDSNAKKASIKWNIDLEVGTSKKVSRQHAVILYNFIKKRFEIKCLSKKFRIKVDNHQYSVKDDSVALKNKSLITIGNEHFYFFLPKNMSDDGRVINPNGDLVDPAIEEQGIPNEDDEEDGSGNEDEEEGVGEEEEEEDDDENGEDNEDENVDEDENGDEDEDEDENQEQNDEEEEEEDSLEDIEMKSTQRKKFKPSEDNENEENSEYDNSDQIQNEEDDEEEDFDESDDAEQNGEVDEEDN